MELKRSIVTLETANGTLLIVPYGIETSLRCTTIRSKQSFNRTLWN